MSITNENIRINIYPFIPKITPLSAETERRLEKQIFQGPLQNGCRDYQVFGKKISPLLDIKREINEGNLHLSRQRKVGAAVALLLSAALVALVTVGLFSFAGPGAAILATLFWLGGFGISGGIFYMTSMNAFKVFREPNSLTELDAKIAEVKKIEIPDKSYRQMQAVVFALDRSLQEAIQKRDQYEACGASIKENEMIIDVDSLAKAKKEVGELAEAVNEFKAKLDEGPPELP